MNSNDVYCPSPEEIAEACREIRKGWSEQEHRRRAVGIALEPYTVPRVHVSQRAEQ